MAHSPCYDPGLLVNRDVWLFFLAGVGLMVGSSAGFAVGIPWLHAWALEAGAWVYASAVLVAPVLALAYVLGFGFVGFPFLESEWRLSRSRFMRTTDSPNTFRACSALVRASRGPVPPIGVTPTLESLAKNCSATSDGPAPDADPKLPFDSAVACIRLPVFYRADAPARPDKTYFDGS